MNNNNLDKINFDSSASNGGLNEELGLEISPYFPVSEDSLDFDQMDIIIAGNDVKFVEDSELGESTVQIEGTDDNTIVFPSVIEILGSSSKIHFYIPCSHTELILHINALQKFFSIELTLIDKEKKEEHNIFISNRITLITIDETEAKLPLIISNGWQRVPLNLVSIMRNAFNKTYLECKNITISGSCRINKVYFQSKNYSDIELPPFLRVIQL